MTHFFLAIRDKVFHRITFSHLLRYGGSSYFSHINSLNNCGHRMRHGPHGFSEATGAVSHVLGTVSLASWDEAAVPYSALCFVRCPRKPGGWIAWMAAQPDWSGAYIKIQHINN